MSPGQDILALYRFIEQNRSLIANLLYNCAADMELDACVPPCEGHGSIPVKPEEKSNGNHEMTDGHFAISSTCRRSCGQDIEQVGSCLQCASFKCNEGAGIGKYRDLIRKTLLKVMR